MRKNLKNCLISNVKKLDWYKGFNETSKVLVPGGPLRVGIQQGHSTTSSQVFSLWSNWEGAPLGLLSAPRILCPLGVPAP